MDLEHKISFTKDVIDNPNLCSELDTRDIQTIGTSVWEGFVKDKQSRQRWEERNSAGMDLAMQIQQSKNFPWPNCSNIVFPLVSIAALQFSTRSYSQLIRGPEIYRYRVVGDQSQQRLDKAKLLGRHLSWQCLEEDEAWEEQHDRLGMNVSIVGTSFVKTRFSTTDQHNTSTLVQARDLVMDYFARSVENAARKTEIIKLYRNEIYERCQRGIYRKDILSEAWFNENARVSVVEAVTKSETDHDRRVGLDAPQGDEDTPFTCLEQHRYLDLDGDGYAEPYIVLQEAASRSILRIVARVDREEDVERTDNGKKIICIRPTEYYTKYGFIPAPDGGIYDIGFGVLLGPLNEAVNTSLNQIFDAATSNLLGGGFVATGAKMQSGVYTRTPGQFKQMKGVGDDIRKGMINWPEIQISDVHFKLIELVIQYADRLAGSTETMAGENPGQNTPAQTYQGMLEQGAQIYRSIFKRYWRSMKEEGKKLHVLNAKFLNDSQTFGSGNERVTREMYKTDPNLLVPTADPAMISDQMRINRAAAVRQGAHSVPGYNLDAVEKQYLESLGIDNISEIYPGAYSDWYQKHPLPNPKMQVEQAKAQSVQMKLEYEKWKTVTELQAGQKKVLAEIDLIKAQAAKLVADIGAEKAAHAVEVFDTLMTHLHGLSDMINDRVEAMRKSGGDDDSARGAGRPEESSSGQSTVEVPASGGGKPNGAVAGGEAQQ